MNSEFQLKLERAREAQPPQLRMLKLDSTTADNAAPRLLGRPLVPFHGHIDYIADGRSRGAPQPERGT